MSAKMTETGNKWVAETRANFAKVANGQYLSRTTNKPTQTVAVPPIQPSEGDDK